MSDFLIFVLIAATIYVTIYLCEYLDKKKKNLDKTEKKFIELIETETEYVFLINTEHIISVYSKESGSLITFQRPDGIEEIEVTKNYTHLKKLIGFNFN